MENQPITLREVESLDEVNFLTHGAMSTMNRSGDTKVIWNRDNPDEVAVAREQFASLKKKGFAAFKVRGKDGEKGEQIHEFDPKVDSIIFVPALVGG